MQGRGRGSEPLRRSGGLPSGASFGEHHPGESRWELTHGLAARVRRKINTVGRIVFAFARNKPRGAGTVSATLLVLASLGYGAYRGEHIANVVAFLRDARDSAANAAGFRIATLSIAGRQRMSEAEILEAAGIGGNTSLLFLDVADARSRLMATPRIAQATVRKLYPDHLEIAVEERHAFALWQMNGKLSIIAEDGTVLAPVDETAIPRLPLVVGPGAGAKAHDFITLLDRYPVIREQTRAAILVADRRWNLKLKTGLDIRLPEVGAQQALESLVALDRDKQILSRDLTAIDMRLPDRLTVRLSDEAAQAREQAIKDKKKRKGGDA